jgi:hypothetical protein
MDVSSPVHKLLPESGRNQCQILPAITNATVVPRLAEAPLREERQSLPFLISWILQILTRG